MQQRSFFITCLLGLSFISSSQAADIVSQKSIGLQVANEMAYHSIEACQKQGFHVSAVVVDRHGNLRTAMRDDRAAKYTLEIAQRKANMALMSGMPSGAFREARRDIQQELNHIKGLIVMQGGMPVRAAGTIIGAIGVSGAPGGDKDEACAVEALEEISERLEFSDLD